MNNLKSILAIDYGRKRTGLAKTDENRITVTPLEVIQSNTANFFSKLYRIIELTAPSLILIGYPYNIDSKEKPTLAIELENFKRKLIKDYPKIEIIFWDESYTSIEASASFNQLSGSINNNKKLKKRKATLDSYAAGHIIRSYLQENET